MNREDLIRRLEQWIDDGDLKTAINTVLALDENELDDEILGLLADAYDGTGEYKKAIAVLDSMKSRMDGYYKWHYRMGRALYGASRDEECENDEELCENILERAGTEFARCMNMNPPEKYLEECDLYLDYIADELGENDEEEDEADPPEMYDEEEMNAVEEHIKEYFGEFPTVLHEIYSPDIHVDVCIVPPCEDRNYYTLVTMGMGAHLMNIPGDLSADEYGRCELLICLPPDWKVGESDEEWFWPIRLLKNLARLPINCVTWLGLGHSVDNREPYCDGTSLCGSLLVNPRAVEAGAASCELPDGAKVNFFEVIPLYREEMEYKIENGNDQLLSLMKSVSHITDVNRENVCVGFVPDSAVYGDVIIDAAYRHAESITEKDLPVPEINASSHIAIYLKWCMEKGLMSGEFNARYPDAAKAEDLRLFLAEKLGGELTLGLFSFRGCLFTEYYYNGDGFDDPDEHLYPCDVDSYAESLFGAQRCLDEFKDEGYLFVPYDENYYRAMSRIIDEKYERFCEFYPESRQNADERFAYGIEGLLDCCCAYCPTELPEMLAAYMSREKIRGMREGFTPVLFMCDCMGSVGLGEGLAAFISGKPAAPFVIAEFPVGEENGVIPAVATHFDTETLPDIHTAELEKAEALIKSRYDISPAVLSIDGGSMTFFFPKGDGAYTCLSGAQIERIDDGFGGTDEKYVPLAVIVGQRLGFGSSFFAPTADDTEIVGAFRDAQKCGEREGFFPVLAAITPELLGFMTKENDAGELFDGEAVLRELSALNIARLRAEGVDYETFTAPADSDPLNRFISYWDYDTGMTMPVMLSKLPVQKPWEVFGCIGFGGGKLPAVSTVIAAAKYWYEKYGAVPAVIGRDTLEFEIPRPVPAESTLQLALEMLGFCPQLREVYGDGAAGRLAAVLRRSSVWFFKW